MSTASRIGFGVGLLLVLGAGMLGCTGDITGLLGDDPALSGDDTDPTKLTDKSAVSIAGEVSIGAPVTGATLTAVALDGDLASLQVESDSSGRWRTTGVVADGPFVLVADGGTVEGEPLLGTLTAYVPVGDTFVLLDEPDYDFEDIEVNILTTIVQRFMAESGADYETAIEYVADFLEIPEGVDLIEDDLSSTAFSNAVFLEGAAACGDFDTYIDDVVSRIKGCEKQSMAAGANVAVLEFSLGRFVGTQILSGLGGAAAKQAFPYVLAMIGLETFETEIKRELSDIKADLADIQVSIASIDRRLGELHKSLGLTEDKLAHYVNHAVVRGYMGDINAVYKELIGLTEGAAKAERFAAKYELNSLSEIDKLHDAMCGDATMPGTLETYAELLANSIPQPDPDGDALLRCYAAMEHYFSLMVAAQMRGVAVRMNVLEYWDQRDGTSGSAQAYLDDEILPMLDEELDHFLMAVERLVVKSADVRTVMVGDYSMFHRDAVEEVFCRADFYAHQMSPKRHPAGLVIRVIGDRPLVEDCLIAPLNAGRFGTPRVVVAPEIGGAEVRQYAPRFPEHYGGNTTYLAWMPVPDPASERALRDSTAPNVWQFYVEPRVAVARLTFPHSQIPFSHRMPSRAPYHEQYEFPHDLSVDARYALYDVNTGEEMRSRGPNEVLFGHGVLIARRVPTFERWSDNRVTRGKYRCTSDANLHTARLTTQVERREEYSVRGKTWYSHLEEMSCGLVNVDATHTHTLGFRASASHRASTDDFSKAAKQSGLVWHYLNWRLKWDLTTRQEGNKKHGRALGYDQKSGDGSKMGTTSYARQYSRSVADMSGNAHWAAGETRHLCSRIRNYIEAHANSAAIVPIGLSDVGSVAHFEHEVEYLEVLPAPQ